MPALTSRRAVRPGLDRPQTQYAWPPSDEAPEVYKRLPDVLDAHPGSIRAHAKAGGSSTASRKHILRPLGVAMAGRDVFDPYKDRRT
jgi:tRNA-splicing ligase RtcB (3'-phosphate/5'-hydroxy nucleic acid ligase)